VARENKLRKTLRIFKSEGNERHYFLIFLNNKTKGLIPFHSKTKLIKNLAKGRGGMMFGLHKELIECEDMVGNDRKWDGCSCSIFLDMVGED
jgi:hypothetical protein